MKMMQRLEKTPPLKMRALLETTARLRRGAPLKIGAFSRKGHRWDRKRWVLSIGPEFHAVDRVGEPNRWTRNIILARRKIDHVIS